MCTPPVELTSAEYVFLSIPGLSSVHQHTSQQLPTLWRPCEGMLVLRPMMHTQTMSLRAVADKLTGPNGQSRLEEDKDAKTLNRYSLFAHACTRTHTHIHTHTHTHTHTHIQLTLPWSRLNCFCSTSCSQTTWRVAWYMYLRQPRKHLCSRTLWWRRTATLSLRHLASRCCFIATQQQRTNVYRAQTNTLSLLKETSAMAKVTKGD